MRSRDIHLLAALLLGVTLGALAAIAFWPHRVLPAPAAAPNPACRSAADQLDHVDWLWRQGTGEGLHPLTPDQKDGVNEAVKAALPALKECRS